MEIPYFTPFNLPCKSCNGSRRDEKKGHDSSCDIGKTYATGVGYEVQDCNCRYRNSNCQSCKGYGGSCYTRE